MWDKIPEKIIYGIQFSSVQSLSNVLLFATPWITACLPVHHQLPEFTQTHVHRVCDGIAAATAKSLQSCLTLCDPIDGSPAGPAVPGILQARTLEWVAISFSNAWKWKVKVKSLSSIQLFTTPWTAAYQAPLPMGFSRQEYWSGVPLPSPVMGLMVPKIKDSGHLMVSN